MIVRRVLLKMSGEAIVAEDSKIISLQRLDGFSQQVAAAMKRSPDLQVAVVVGGGNILRGKDFPEVGRVKADHMGMLATVINSLALQDSLARSELTSRVLTGIEIPRVAEPYIHGRAIRHLDKGRVVVFAGGTGNPYFTTDMAAALRATEIEAEVVLLAKYGTDGVYDKDPNKFGEAIKLPATLCYDTLLSRNLGVMDMTAVSHCKEHHVPIYIFDMERPNAVTNALLGETDGGTYISDVGEG